MRKLIRSWRSASLAIALVSISLLAGPAIAQTTTGSISGLVADESGGVLPGASILAVHVPSGSRYEATSRADGHYAIQGVRVGGPYSVTVTMSGFQPRVANNVTVNLGVAADVNATLKTASLTEEVTVTAETDAVFSSARSGAATAISRDVIATLPTQSDRIDSFVRLSPQASGKDLSFGGSDNRLNNITVDGSYFNNSFGLGAAPGDRTGVAPISMAAVEEMQVNVAPVDVRQGHFTGASVNAVTRSGTNSVKGSAYWWFRNNDLVGKKPGDNVFNPGTFDFHKYGAYLSGPVIKNKLFFFLSYEDDATTQPGTTFKANTGGQTVGGNTTRVNASDLDTLSTYLKTNFKYDTGGYQDYDFSTPSKRYLAKLDYNINDRNKLAVRFSRLDSSTDVLLSNSSSLGFGNRRTSTLGLNFENSNYKILENNRSFIGELNSTLSNNSANSLIVGYNKSDESRGYKGELFPMVDILKEGSVYTTFGFEPFTPNNELRYKSWQFQDNFTKFFNKHTVTVGASAERYESDNVFYSGSQGIYVYNSLDDFYADANGYLANPNRTSTANPARRFQVRYLNIPGLDKPSQPLQVWYAGIYGQDEYQVSPNLKVSAGIRVDRPSFADTGFQNAVADALTFRDENGSPVKYQTKKLPDANLQWSPRVGFNWDVNGAHTTQVRGTSGVFSGPPLYVWISNQVGNTGVLTGFLDSSSNANFPFNPSPNAYKPTSVTGAPAATYELALTDPKFKFPQVWRSNIAVDRKLPGNITGTAEFIYNRDVNGIYYINANQTAPNSSFTGADNRPRWTSTAANRIYSNIADAVVLKNQNVGRSWHGSLAFEKTFRSGFAKVGYSYGEAKNTVDAGSVAFGSWSGNPQSSNPNTPGLGYGSNSPGTRFFAAASYSKEYFSFGKTTVGIFWQGIQGNGSYTVSGDLNNDGTSNNDLIYIQNSATETNFVPYTSGGVTFTAAAQQQAWDAYISQDKYLSKHRGQYAVRNAVFLPIVRQADLSIAQDIFRNIKGKRNALQFRADILNVANLINHNWGVGVRFISAQPLTIASAAQGGAVNAAGAPQYTLRSFNGALMTTSYQSTAAIGDVYRVQFALKYNFN
ncbi:MAG: carboxypeptidase regulatory-like domain-containing protein [Vicinamibacteria bacterium]